MLTATWGKHFFKADATKCASEIMEICDQMESATPQQILGIGTQRANGNGRYHINPDNVTII